MEDEKNTRFGEIQRDQVFFIYDRTALKSEWDNPETAILFFSPTTVDLQEQCSLCGQLVGMAAFTENIFSSKPSVFKMKRGKFAIKFVSHFIMVLGGKLSDQDDLLSKLLEDLYCIFQFYHKSFEQIIKEFKSCQDYSARMTQIWSSYLPFAKHYRQDLFTFLDTVPYISFTKAGSFVYLKAMKILEACQRRSYVYCGCIMTEGRIIASQVQSKILRYLSLLKPNQDHLPVEQLETESNLPHGVRIFPVYITKDEYELIRTVSEQSPYSRSRNSLKEKIYSQSHDETTSSRGHADSSSSVGSRSELQRSFTDHDRSLRIRTQSTDAVSLEGNNEKPQNIDIAESNSSNLQAKPSADKLAVVISNTDGISNQKKSVFSNTQINSNPLEDSLPPEQEFQAYDSSDADSIWELEFSGKIEDLKQCVNKFNQSYNANFKNQDFVTQENDLKNTSCDIPKAKIENNSEGKVGLDSYEEMHMNQHTSACETKSIITCKEPLNRNEFDDRNNESKVDVPGDSKDSCHVKVNNIDNASSIGNSKTQLKFLNHNHCSDSMKISEDSYCTDTGKQSTTDIVNVDAKICECKLSKLQLDASSDQEVTDINSREADSKLLCTTDVSLMNCMNGNSKPNHHIVAESVKTDQTDMLQTNHDNSDEIETKNAGKPKQEACKDNQSFSEKNGSCTKHKDEEILQQPSEVRDDVQGIDDSSQRESELGAEYADNAALHFSVGSLTQNIKKELKLKDPTNQVDAGYCSMDNDLNKQTSDCKEAAISTKENEEQVQENQESDEQEGEDELESLHLYVQAHSNTVMVLFLEPQIEYDKKSLKSIYETVLPYLGELEAHVQNVVDSRDESTVEDFVYLRNNKSQRKCKSNCEFISQRDWNFGQTVQMLHSQFNNSDNFVDATFRNYTTAVYGKRSGNQETYYQQRGSYKPIQGAPTPYDMSCVMDRRVGSKLRKDDLETII